MKKSFACLIVLLVLLIGCKKDDNIIPTKSPEEILTGQLWKLDEIRAVQNNSTIYYKRGGSSNTVNLDTESMQFKSDFTGTTYTSSGNYPFTWSFSNTAKTNLKFTIQYSPSLSLQINWENIIYSNTLLRYTEYFTHPSLGNTLGECFRSPK